MGVSALRNFAKLFHGGILCLTLFLILKSAFSSGFRNITSKTMGGPGTADLPTLREFTLEKASEGLQSGNFTSFDLVKAYLARIDEVSELNAVLQVNPDALEMARRLDEERIQMGSRGYVSIFSNRFMLLPRH